MDKSIEVHNTSGYFPVNWLELLILVELTQPLKIKHCSLNKIMEVHLLHTTPFYKVPTAQNLILNSLSDII